MKRGDGNLWINLLFLLIGVFLVSSNWSALAEEKAAIAGKSLLQEETVIPGTRLPCSERLPISQPPPQLCHDQD